MPTASRQDRYNYLILPENAYNTLCPHPQTQTFYNYPFSTAQVIGTLLLSTIPIFVGAFLEPSRRFGLFTGFALLAFGLIFFASVSPAVGTTKTRHVETPTEVQTIYVLRPFFARKKCEVQYGVTGGNPFRTERLLWWKLKVRHEPAFWVANW